MSETITFKPTNTAHPPFTLKYVPTESIESLRQQLATRLEVEEYQLKLIFKGRVLHDKLTAGQCKLTQGAVMVVVSNKQPPKISVPSSQQAVPRSGLNTGLGAQNPMGFGNYSLINHPQYMSAISSVTNQEKLEEMMEDPYYQGMMQDIMRDPETLKQLLEQNPMTRNMLEQNPTMKMILSNPELMKMVFTPSNLKMARELQKNNHFDPNSLVAQNFGFPNMGFNMPNGQNSQNIPNIQNMQSMMNMMNMMNMPNFAMNQGNAGYMGMNMNTNPGNTGANSVNMGQNSLSSEQKYQKELKELENMGFKDREKCIEALKAANGDIDGAIQRLCTD